MKNKLNKGEGRKGGNALIPEGDTRDLTEATNHFETDQREDEFEIRIEPREANVADLMAFRNGKLRVPERFKERRPDLHFCWMKVGPKNSMLNHLDRGYVEVTQKGSQVSVPAGKSEPEGTRMVLMACTKKNYENIMRLHKERTLDQTRSLGRKERVDVIDKSTEDRVINDMDFGELDRLSNPV